MDDKSAAYSPKYMKQCLQDDFKENKLVSIAEGKASIVTLRETADSLLHDFYKSPKNVDASLEKLRLIETAGKLIKNDIKGIMTSTEFYPSHADISSLGNNLDYLPDYLRCLLNHLFKEDIKTTSIGQSIIQATRPRDLIAPIQLGVGVQMHHHFSSKFLVDSLYRHGFCTQMCKCMNAAQL